MTREDIIRKLTSRKFWVAVVGFIGQLLVSFGMDANSAEKITARIMAGASVVAYIIAEGIVDAGREAESIVSTTNYNGAEALAYGLGGIPPDEEGDE
jgi:ABC-type Na+ efflux pump permease subunit